MQMCGQSEIGGNYTDPDKYIYAITAEMRP